MTASKLGIPQSIFDSPSARRIQRDGHNQACQELERTPRHMLSEGNPNHPIHDTLFGYDREEFMAKQYREKRHD